MAQKITMLQMAKIFQRMANQFPNEEILSIEKTNVIINGIDSPYIVQTNRHTLYLPSELTETVSPIRIHTPTDKIPFYGIEFNYAPGYENNTSDNFVQACRDILSDTTDSNWCYYSGHQTTDTGRQLFIYIGHIHPDDIDNIALRIAQRLNTYIE